MAKATDESEIIGQTGVSERLAISCASGLIKSTSKGPCRSSKTKGINIAISNAFLARQGLISLKDLWIKKLQKTARQPKTFTIR